MEHQRGIVSLVECSTNLLRLRKRVARESVLSRLRWVDRFGRATSRCLPFVTHPCPRSTRAGWYDGLLLRRHTHGCYLRASVLFLIRGSWNKVAIFACLLWLPFSLPRFPLQYLKAEHLVKYILEQTTKL